MKDAREMCSIAHAKLGGALSVVAGGVPKHRTRKASHKRASHKRARQHQNASRCLDTHSMSTHTHSLCPAICVKRLVETLKSLGTHTEEW